MLDTEQPWIHVCSSLASLPRSSFPNPVGSCLYFARDLPKVWHLVGAPHPLHTISWTLSHAHPGNNMLRLLTTGPPTRAHLHFKFPGIVEVCVPEPRALSCSWTAEIHQVGRPPRVGSGPGTSDGASAPKAVKNVFISSSPLEAARAPATKCSGCRFGAWRHWSLLHPHTHQIQVLL